MPTLPQKAVANKPAERDWAAALQAEMVTVVRQAIVRERGFGPVGRVAPMPSTARTINVTVPMMVGTHSTAHTLTCDSPSRA